MSEDNDQQKPKRGAAHDIGALATFGAAVYGADRLSANKDIKDHLNGKKTDTKIGKEVDKAIKADKTIAANKGGLDRLNTVKDTSKLTEATYATSKKGVHGLDWKYDGKHVPGVENLKELPKDIKAGQKLTGKEAVKAIESTRKATEKELVKDIRNASKIKMGAGLKSAGTGRMALILGSACAIGVAGGYVSNQLFGGRHTNREAERRLNQDLGRGV